VRGKRRIYSFLRCSLTGSGHQPSIGLKARPERLEQQKRQDLERMRGKGAFIVFFTWFPKKIRRQPSIGLKARQERLEDKIWKECAEKDALKIFLTSKKNEM
jgi:hypothetical protein